MAQIFEGHSGHPPPPLAADPNYRYGNDRRCCCSVRRDMHKIYQMVGYCPQFDALNPLLTGREQLAFYARIRGIQEKDIEKVPLSSLLCFAKFTW